jgi:PAS domain S-box-containing protein
VSSVRFSTAVEAGTDVFELIAEAIPHIVWMAGADGSTEYFNRRGTDYTGQPPDANYGWDWVELVHPDDMERARRSWDHATRTQTPYELEYRIRRYDGQYRWHAFRGLPVRRPDGQVVKWIGTAIDIEDIKRLEERLRASERESARSSIPLEAMFTAAPVGIGFVDRQLRVQHVNEALSAATGASVSRHIGRPVGEVWPELRVPLESLAARVADGGGEGEREPVFVLGGGDDDRGPARFAMWCYPVYAGGEVIGFGIASTDASMCAPEPPRRRPSFLNDTKVEILRLMREGRSNREIAAAVHLSENTVKTHVRELLRNLDAHNRMQAVRRATELGWI